MPSLQLQLVISPSVVHARDLKLFFLKAPKASLVFSYSALPLIFVVFLFFFFNMRLLGEKGAFLREISEKRNFFLTNSIIPSKVDLPTVDPSCKK